MIKYVDNSVNSDHDAAIDHPHEEQILTAPTFNIGDTVLITTDNWFIAPNGRQYRAAFGTVHGIYDSSDALGIRTNRNSSNWYVQIGNLLIAGCQIHYAVSSTNVEYGLVADWTESNGVVTHFERPSTIYNADI